MGSYFFLWVLKLTERTWPLSAYPSSARMALAASSWSRMFTNAKPLFFLVSASFITLMESMAPYGPNSCHSASSSVSSPILYTYTVVRGGSPAAGIAKSGMGWTMAMGLNRCDPFPCTGVLRANLTVNGWDPGVMGTPFKPAMASSAWRRVSKRTKATPCAALLLVMLPKGLNKALTVSRQVSGGRPLTYKLHPLVPFCIWSGLTWAKATLKAFPCRLSPSKVALARSASSGPEYSTKPYPRSPTSRQLWMRPALLNRACMPSRDSCSGM